MYAPDQNQSAAPALDRRSSTAGRLAESFRPVALPALAAAVLVSAVAGKAVTARRTKAARMQDRFEHEDAPLI